MQASAVEGLVRWSNCGITTRGPRSLFNQFDIIAANPAGVYLQGPYAALVSEGTMGDGQTTLVYDPVTGELAVDAPFGQELTSINVTSASGMFVGGKPAVLDGAFDNFAEDNVFKATEDNVFKATFGGSFGSISFGNVLPADIAADDLAADLSAVGSLVGGGDLREVDLIYVPEPTTAVLILVGALGLIVVRRRILSPMIPKPRRIAWSVIPVHETESSMLCRILLFQLRMGNRRNHKSVIPPTKSITVAGSGM